MRLSKRLETIVKQAALVCGGEAAADVGTDHGFVPIRLIEEGAADRVIAMDVRKGPLMRAQEHVIQFGMEEQIETRLSDGLEKLMPGEAKTVIIAGMGGELMLRILRDGERKSATGFCLPSRSCLCSGMVWRSWALRLSVRRWLRRTANTIRSSQQSRDRCIMKRKRITDTEPF